jgi:hypothetical protein
MKIAWAKGSSLNCCCTRVANPSICLRMSVYPHATYIFVPAGSWFNIVLSRSQLWQRLLTDLHR